MYAQEAYLTPYYRNYIRRERRLRTGLRILTAAAVCMAVCITAGAVAADKGIIKGKKIINEPYTAVQPGLLSAVMVDMIHNDAAEIKAVAEAARVPLVFVDAGHGGEDGGCVSAGVIEKDVNLEIAMLVKTRLEACGYRVMMAREDDTFISKEDRVKAANEAKADIYVSIHQNSSEYRDVSGMEVWFDGEDTRRDNKKLAQLISSETAQSIEAVERELRGNADFHVTGSTLMPACLIETGFLSNSKERNKLVTREYQEKIACGIVNGIENYFNTMLK